MNIRKLVYDYLKILLGGVLFALGFRFFLLPNNIVTGGVSGLSMIIHHLTGLPVGALMLLLNAPLFFFTWRMLGRAFFVSALAGVVVTSVLVDVLALVPVAATRDMLLAAVYGGVLLGLGLGIVLSAGASTGGSDLAARLLRKRRPDLPMGQMILVIDSVVVALGALVFRRYDSALYAVIAIFICNRLVDIILYGVNYAKVAYIISDQSDAIRGRITSQLGRGLTVLRGEGGYSGQEKAVLLCAIKQRQQITELKRIVYGQDPDAFIIISDAREVLGLGFGAVEE